MPTYDYKCECGETQEVFHGMKSNPVVECACGKSMSRSISVNITGVDAGFSAAKIMKQTTYQRKRNAELSVKQIERYGSDGGLSLKPNVNGNQVGSWEEAKKLATSLGKNTKEYDRLISIEKRSGNYKRIDEAKLKEKKRQASQA